MEEKEREEYLLKRKRRVKRIKKFLIISLIVLLALPNFLCIYLLVQVNQLNRTLEATEEALWQLTVKTEDANATAVLAQALKPMHVTDDRLEAVIPDSELYAGKQLVYLTFDDGPGEYTNEILDILKQYNVKATFFVLAKDGYEEEYRRIVEEGHTLALHSYTHKYGQIYESPEAFREDIQLLSDYLYEITGERCTFYRFPGGSSNTIVKFDKDLLFDVLEEEGLIYYDWNVTSKDASVDTLSTGAITENVLNGVEQAGNSVVLMHDAAGKHTTVEALPQILERLLEDDNIQILPITDGTKPVCHVIRTESAEE